MDTEIKPSKLEFTGSAWPARLGGISIFLSILGIFFYFPDVPVFILGISFVFMLITILFSADVSVIADNPSRTLTFTKRRMFGSSQVAYGYEDILFLCQVITTTTNQKGEEVKDTSYTIGLNSQTTTLQPNYLGRRLIPVTIPKSGFSVVSAFLGNTEEFTRTKLIADFIGVPLYIQGGEHDKLANIQADTPQYIEEIKKCLKLLIKLKMLCLKQKQKMID
jgi:hypothetical protein